MKFLLSVSLLFVFSCVYSQDKNKFYALDANLNETVLDSSKFILWVHEIEGANWQFDYYRTWGSLVKTQTFADRQGMVLNGRSSIYNTFGNLDSTGLFDHGKRNGVFMKFKTITNDSIVQIRHYEFAQDSLLTWMDMETNHHTIQDSIQIYHALYPGGSEELKKYLSQQIIYPERAKEKSIQGTTIILFIENGEGQATDFFLQKSVEYSIDQEVIRALKGIPTWLPAPQQKSFFQYYYQGVTVMPHQD